VLEPDVPPNACSFLLSKSTRLIDTKRWHTLVTYADSWRGHTGAIYRAAGRATGPLQKQLNATDDRTADTA
jgi:hypothetical protein